MTVRGPELRPLRDVAWDRMVAFAANCATAARARGDGDEERRWLDQMILMERYDRAATAEERGR